jgi:hypothetical protein
MHCKINKSVSFNSLQFTKLTFSTFWNSVECWSCDSIQWRRGREYRCIPACIRSMKSISTVIKRWIASCRRFSVDWTFCHGCDGNYSDDDCKENEFSVDEGIYSLPSNLITSTPLQLLCNGYQVNTSYFCLIFY